MGLSAARLGVQTVVAVPAAYARMVEPRLRI